MIKVPFRLIKPIIDALADLHYKARPGAREIDSMVPKDYDDDKSPLDHYVAVNFATGVADAIGTLIENLSLLHPICDEEGKSAISDLLTSLLDEPGDPDGTKASDLLKKGEEEFLAELKKTPENRENDFLLEMLSGRAKN